MNVKQNISILFYRKNQKINASGEIPIYARITIDGLKEELATGVKVRDVDWDNETKLVLPSDPGWKKSNKKIQQIRVDLERHFYLVQAKLSIATPKEVKESYMTPVNGHDQQNQRMANLRLSESIDIIALAYVNFCKRVRKTHSKNIQLPLEKQQLLNEEKEEIRKNIEKLSRQAIAIFDDKNHTKTLMLAIDEYLLHFVQLAIVGHRSPNTLEKWIGRKKRYAEFLQYRYKLYDIPLFQLEFKFIDELVKYLLVQHEVEENTAMKYAQCVKEIMDRTVANGWTTANIFSTFQCRYIDPEHTWPSMDEFEYLIKYQFEKPILNEIRDVAIFQAFTGFSYQETYAAESGDIIKGVDGQHWISKSRQKTGFDESVPLLPIVEKIIEKYKGHPVCCRSGRLLPVPSNEYYNRCLKEIAGIINTRMLNNTHQLRFFFANEVTFNQGVPLKTVSKMLGHRSVKTTEIYVRANKNNIAENMEMVKGKLFDQEGNLKSKSRVSNISVLRIVR